MTLFSNQTERLSGFPMRPRLSIGSLLLVLSTTSSAALPLPLPGWSIAAGPSTSRLLPSRTNPTRSYTPPRPAVELHHASRPTLCRFANRNAPCPAPAPTVHRAASRTRSPPTYSTRARARARSPAARRPRFSPAQPRQRKPDRRFPPPSPPLLIIPPSSSSFLSISLSRFGSGSGFGSESGSGSGVVGRRTFGEDPGAAPGGRPGTARCRSWRRWPDRC